MAGKVKHTKEQVLEAIRGSGGIKQTIAESLSVHRHTVDNYLERWAYVRQAYKDECDKVGDIAESVIIKAMRNNDVNTARWYAKHKLKERGYVERQEFDLRNVDAEIENELARLASSGED